MTSETTGEEHWQEIADMYRLLLAFKPSPLTRLNQSYCLFRAGQRQEARALLQELESALPKDHFYLTLIRSVVLETEADTIRAMLQTAIDSTSQEVRKIYIREHLFPNDIEVNFNLL